jgi:hypothetical protein
MIACNESDVKSVNKDECDFRSSNQRIRELYDFRDYSLASTFNLHLILHRNFR